MAMLRRAALVSVWYAPMTLFDQPLTLESLLARIEALEARVMDKPVRQSTEVPPELRQAWSLWTLHKQGSKGWTALAKKQQAHKLADLSGGNSDTAMAVVEQAIEHGWATFYPLREQAKTAQAPAVRGPKEAFKPSETPLERAQAWTRQRYQRGDFGEGDAAREAFAAEMAKIVSKHRGGKMAAAEQGRPA